MNYYLFNKNEFVYAYLTKSKLEFVYVYLIINYYFLKYLSIYIF